MSWEADGVNLYETGLPEIGFNFDGFIILTVKFVIGEASKNFDFCMGACLTSYALPKGFNSLDIGIGSDSSVRTVLAYPSIAGSIRRQNRCWWF